MPSEQLQEEGDPAMSIDAPTTSLLARAVKEKTESPEGPLVVDMGAPLLTQVWRLESTVYNAWVHTPHVFHDGRKHARLFESGVLEAFTRTPWWVVPLLWLPIAAGLMSPYLLLPPSPSPRPLSEGAVLLALGACLWSLTEYCVHRFVFHADHAAGGVPDNALVRVLHFTLHGLHHKTPCDGERLVLPPALSAALLPLVWGVYKAFFPALPPDAFAFMFGGGVVAYVVYDTTHYMLHHVPNGGPPLWCHLVRLHARHHALLGHEAAGFGITSPWWDWVMATGVRLGRV